MDTTQENASELNSSMFVGTFPRSLWMCLIKPLWSKGGIQSLHDVGGWHEVECPTGFVSLQEAPFPRDMHLTLNVPAFCFKLEHISTNIAPKYQTMLYIGTIPNQISILRPCLNSKFKSTMMESEMQLGMKFGLECGNP